MEGGVGGGRGEAVSCTLRLVVSCAAAALRQGLDTTITEYGGNLSMGERQLLCLARVLLQPAAYVRLREVVALGLVVLASRFRLVWLCKDGCAVFPRHPF
jgi:hypothetical protein